MSETKDGLRHVRACPTQWMGADAPCIPACLAFREATGLAEKVLGARASARAWVEKALELEAELSRAGDALEMAWATIANVGHKQGDWESQHPLWLEIAVKWRDEHWHPFVNRRHAARTETP